jgi:hypothetical protein
MSWQKIGKAIGKAAPLLGAALGSPAGAAIGELLANTLGVDATPSAVANAIKNDPQAALKLREFELANEQHIRDHAFRVLDVELKDVQNARAENKHSIMPALICGALTVLVGIGGIALFRYSIPEANSELAYILYGAILAKFGDSIAYWIGTTRSSAEKDRILRK